MKAGHKLVKDMGTMLDMNAETKQRKARTENEAWNKNVFEPIAATISGKVNDMVRSFLCPPPGLLLTRDCCKTVLRTINRSIGVNEKNISNFLTPPTARVLSSVTLSLNQSMTLSNPTGRISR